jgi:hypothetical protein
MASPALVASRRPRQITSGSPAGGGRGRAAQCEARSLPWWQRGVGAIAATMLPTGSCCWAALHRLTGSTGSPRRTASRRFSRPIQRSGGRT